MYTIKTEDFNLQLTPGADSLMVDVRCDGFSGHACFDMEDFLIADFILQIKEMYENLEGSAKLQDVDHYKLFNTENNHNARTFFNEQHICSETVERICEIINGVSYSKNRGSSPKSIEGKIVQARHDYIKAFVDEFMCEINAEK